MESLDIPIESPDSFEQVRRRQMARNQSARVHDTDGFVGFFRRVALAAYARDYQKAHPDEPPPKFDAKTWTLYPQPAPRPKPTPDPEALRAEEARIRAKPPPDSAARSSKRIGHRKPASRVAWKFQEDDALALARSRIPLPGDGNRSRTLQRHPSLGRENAFCDASTYKGKVHVKRMPNSSAMDGAAEDAQIAELYRMGILYDGDDKLARNSASAINLNTIQHDEPVYTIRPARRSRRAQKGAARGYKGSLPLDLSFSDLGQDDHLAQYLSGRSKPDSMDINTSEDCSHDNNNNNDADADETLQQQSSDHRRSSAPMRVIYELATSRPSFDIDTSQPPDLMTDSLSDDYECFSDSELDEDHDMPSQREVHDAAAATSASGPWVLLGDDS